MEEKTVDMASDELWSLNMADNDIFSKIPNHIIHCILAFLPSVKDVVRTSSVSKSLHQAWLSFPIPKFNLGDFPDCSRDGKEKQLQFISFVDNTLQRFGGKNGKGMKSFNLSTKSKMAHHTNRWVGMALDIQVEHLALHIYNESSLPCLIPDTILSAYWLKSLKLVGYTICIQSLSESSRVDLPLLTSLRIEECNHINNQQLQKLLSGCPALEEIALLECESLSKVDIFYHPNLEIMEFTVSESTSDDRVAIRVSAPKLKSFSYNCGDSMWCECDDVVVNIHNSPELKSLIIRNENRTDEWFNKFITQFPLLENLTIACCALRKIRIPNPLLEKINIRYCGLKDVVISSKKLTSFCLFTYYSSIPNLCIQMEVENPPNDCMVNISDPFHVLGSHLMEVSWYCKLKEFLTHTFTVKSLEINLCALDAKDGDMNEEDAQKKWPHEVCNIENLRLRVSVPSSCHLPILNGLLSTCHPTTIELDVTSDNSFDNLVCEELGNRQNNSKCWCKDDFKCWKHQLKEVKIEKIKGVDLEKHLDWKALFDVLPTLEYGNTIYFKLMW